MRRLETSDFKKKWGKQGGKRPVKTLNPWNSGPTPVARGGSEASACRTPGPMEWAKAKTCGDDRGVL